MLDAAPQSSRIARSDTETTRARIVAAAEELFASRGIDDVSLVEVGKAAGQRNRSAVQYHFGDREGLLHAILDKHTPSIEAERRARLDAIEAADAPDLRRSVEAFVLPVAARLEDPDGGIAFIRLNAELIGHARHPLMRLSEQRPNRAAEQLSALFSRIASPVPKALWQARWLLLVGLLFHGLADWTRLAEHTDGAPLPRNVFVSHLVDQIEAVLRTPVSAATLERLATTPRG